MVSKFDEDVDLDDYQVDEGIASKPSSEHQLDRREDHTTTLGSGPLGAL